LKRRKNLKKRMLYSLKRKLKLLKRQKRIAFWLLLMPKKELLKRLLKRKKIWLRQKD